MFFALSHRPEFHQRSLEEAKSHLHLPELRPPRAPMAFCSVWNRRYKVAEYDECLKLSPLALQDSEGAGGDNPRPASKLQVGPCVRCAVMRLNATWYAPLLERGFRKEEASGAAVFSSS